MLFILKDAVLFIIPPNYLSGILHYISTLSKQPASFPDLSPPDMGMMPL